MSILPVPGARSLRRVLAAMFVAVTACAISLGAASPVLAADPKPNTPIEHFLFLMQGDRTFDNYFGTYPGADGIPAKACQVFVRTRPANGCVKPFHVDGKAVGALSPGESVLKAQFDGGAMDGFVSAYVAQGRDGTAAMGYYDRSDLPFSWAAADKYVLFDKFFSSAFHGTRDNRSYWVSAAPAPGGTLTLPKGGYGDAPTIFDRLQAAGVSWKFYVQDYDPKQTFRSSTTSPVGQAVRVPLVDYARFVDDPKLASHIVDMSQYYTDLTAGTLPAVAYIATAGASERSSRSIPVAQDLLRDLTTQLMLSPYWHSSALMWSYDGSGGWYDHVAPPKIGADQLGFRVPALLVSPYAKPGHIEHAQLDYTSALKFIEDNWRLAPLTARDKSASSIASVFDFSTPPRTPDLITPVKAETGAVVRVSTAYQAYGAATGLALFLVLMAFVWPWIYRFVAGRPAVLLARSRVQALRAKALRSAQDGPVDGGGSASSVSVRAGHHPTPPRQFDHSGASDEPFVITTLATMVKAPPQRTGDVIGEPIHLGSQGAWEKLPTVIVGEVTDVVDVPTPTEPREKEPAAAAPVAAEAETKGETKAETNAVTDEAGDTAPEAQVDDVAEVEDVATSQDRDQLQDAVQDKAHDKRAEFSRPMKPSQKAAKAARARAAKARAAKAQVMRARVGQGRVAGQSSARAQAQGQGQGQDGDDVVIDLTADDAEQPAGVEDKR